MGCYWAALDKDLDETEEQYMGRCWVALELARTMSGLWPLPTVPNFRYSGEVGRST